MFDFVLSFEAPGRKRSREAVNTEAAAVEAVQAGSPTAEVEVSELPRKRFLLVLSEGEDEEEVPPVAGTVGDTEVVAAGALDAEAIIAEALDAEAAVDEVAGEAATAEVAASETAAVEVADIEEAAIETPDGKAIAVGPGLVALVGSPPAGITVPSLAAIAPVEPSPVIPRRPSGITIRSPPRPSLPLFTAVVAPSPPIVSTVMAVTQEPLVEGELVVIEPLAISTSTLTPVASVNVSMLQITLVSGVGDRGLARGYRGLHSLFHSFQEPVSSDDLTELFASLHEEGSSSTSVALLDEDSRAAIERLRDFLHLGVNHMANARPSRNSDLALIRPWPSVYWTRPS
ncbi:uncharacterized protein Pyn_26618 [Prunus yedoensis var. nudiflora]|uniref:Uncharacterized protein n=1 Tax=Prunus yedoensis var. nudiflora TaxID=2094558 RepID=A0A314UL59_PRUYE|nr:uncharacterized protein Pyn_26618 [Prunus yedoensis var. nudiflora]